MSTPVFVYQYAENPETGMVHLHTEQNAYRTLCGRRIYADWPAGDETLSGIAATCSTCRGKRGLPTVERG